jgi:hypothetical protein
MNRKTTTTAAPAVVFALSAVATHTADGQLVATRPGQPWAGDDPFVIERPDLFGEARPEWLCRTVALPANPDADLAGAC